ncbi:MAG: DUF4097 family beta strand repeat-containing protein [Candidatus Acidiferrales bacterium]
MDAGNLQAKSGSVVSAVIRVAIAAACLLCVSSSVFAFTQVFEQSYPLSSGGRFALVNVNGSVQVEGWERDEVEVRAVKTGEGDDGDLNNVRIEVESARDGVAVHTRYPKGEGVPVFVDYQIRVPYRVLLSDIATVNGSVSIRGVEGSGDLHSVNGNVEVTDSAGRFSAHTTNGNVHLELSRLADGAPMVLETINGSVLLGLPSNARGDIRARSLNGELNSDLPRIVRGSYEGRGFHGTLGSGGGAITLRTVNGGIRILLERPGV